MQARLDPPGPDLPPRPPFRLEETVPTHSPLGPTPPARMPSARIKKGARIELPPISWTGK